MRELKNARKIFEKHSKDVTCLDVDEEKNLVFTGSLDGTLRLWDLKTNMQVKVNSFERKSIDFLVWTDKNQLLLVVLAERLESKLVLFDSILDSVPGQLDALDRIVNLTLVKSESCVLAQFKVGKFTLYSFPGFCPLKNFSLDQCLSLVTLIRDSVVYFDSSYLKLWDIHSDSVKSWINIKVTQNSVTAASEGFLVWSYFDLIYYTTPELNFVKTLHLHTFPVISLCNNLNLFASLSGDCLLVVWNIQTQQVLWSKSLNFTSFKLKLLKIGSIVLADIFRTVKHVSQNATQDFPGHDFEVTCECSSFDKTLIATGSRDCSVQVWQKDTGCHLVSFKGHELFITTATFTQSGKFLVSGSQDSTVVVWDLKNQSLMHVFRIFDKPVNHLVSLASNELVLGCNLSPSLFLLNADSQKFWVISSDFDQVVDSVKVFSGEKFCVCLTRRFVWVFKLCKFYRLG